jgi:hypothetical protein
MWGCLGVEDRAGTPSLEKNGLVGRVFDTKTELSKTRGLGRWKANGRRMTGLMEW